MMRTLPSGKPATERLLAPPPYPIITFRNSSGGKLVCNQTGVKMSRAKTGKYRITHTEKGVSVSSQYLSSLRSKKVPSSVVPQVTRDSAGDSQCPHCHEWNYTALPLGKKTCCSCHKEFETI